MAKDKSIPDHAENPLSPEISLRFMISPEANPSVYAALKSLSGHDLTRRVQHLMILGLEHEKQTALVEALTEQATLSSELMRRLLGNGEEIQFGKANPDVIGAKQPRHLGSAASEPDTAQDEAEAAAAAERLHKMALKLASH